MAKSPGVRTTETDLTGSKRPSKGSGKVKTTVKNGDKKGGKKGR